jgi:hypothetical protein
MSRIKVRGKIWQCRDGDIDEMDRFYGFCIYSHRLIEINPKQTEHSRLDTVIHEFLHATHTYPSERKIRTLAGVLCRAPWADGWRRQVPVADKKCITPKRRIRRRNAGACRPS